MYTVMGLVFSIIAIFYLGWSCWAVSKTSMSAERRIGTRTDVSHCLIGWGSIHLQEEFIVIMEVIYLQESHGDKEELVEPTRARRTKCLCSREAIDVRSGCLRIPFLSGMSASSSTA